VSVTVTALLGSQALGLIGIDIFALLGSSERRYRRFSAATTPRSAGRVRMIVWESGRGPRLLGCGPVGCVALLVLSLAITILVLALSGGACTIFVFP
jgi:hypothetical protein